MEDKEVNPNALKLFNETAQAIAKLEADLAKSRNLRALSGDKLASKRKKTEVKAREKLEKALKALDEKEKTELKALDEEIISIKCALDLSKKRLMDVAKDVGKAEPPEAPRTIAPTFVG
jgi:SMC interacting uncharacterized protein involved in chromosome segregation